MLPSCGVVGLSVCLSVCLSVTVTDVYPGKTAGPIEMPLGMWVGVGRCDHGFDLGPDPPRGRGNFRGKYGTLH